MEKTLTILMPVYNAGPFVADAIASVQAQSYGDFHLRIMDDGSTDNTLEICQRIAASDSRITVEHHNNVGIANTMNQALETATSSWVFSMHGDDLMLPNRLERQREFILSNPDLAVVSGLVRLIDVQGREIGIGRSDLVNRDAVTEAVSSGRCIAFNHPATAFRPDVIKKVGGYRQDFWPAEDTELWNRVAAAGHKILVQDEYLLKYRVHGSSASNSQARLMVRKQSWVNRCIDARRHGESEPTWDQFMHERDSAPWAVRLNQCRREMSRTLYQAAQGHFAARKYGSLLPSLAAAVALEPELVLPRLMPRLFGRKAV